jgi:hypothetical protein
LQEKHAVTLLHIPTLAQKVLPLKTFSRYRLKGVSRRPNFVTAARPDFSNML